MPWNNTCVAGTSGNRRTFPRQRPKSRRDAQSIRNSCTKCGAERLGDAPSVNSPITRSSARLEIGELIDYWRKYYDWQKQEALLNRFNQFEATIDRTKLHLIHEKGRGATPIPIILTHGYPVSFFRFYKLIPLLTDPAAHGGDDADSFDVVVPSLPGFGFSEPRQKSGGVFGFGGLWNKLMTDTLGYAKFGAHGGDWGSTVTEHLARSHASSLIGIHLTDVPFCLSETKRP